MFDKLEGWRGHRGHKETPECSQDYEVVGAAPTPRSGEAGGSGAVPPPLQGAYSSRALADSSDGEDDEGSDDFDPGIPAGETVGPTTGNRGTAVQEPRQPQRSKKPPAEWGAPDPSKVRESLSFPVVSRFAYDAFRARYPMCTLTFNEWVQDCLWLAWKAMGLHPAAIWTAPMADPPPGAVQPFLTDEPIDFILEEPQSAA